MTCSLHHQVCHQTGNHQLTKKQRNNEDYPLPEKGRG